MRALLLSALSARRIAAFQRRGKALKRVPASTDPNHHLRCQTLVISCVVGQTPVPTRLLHTRCRPLRLSTTHPRPTLPVRRSEHSSFTMIPLS